MCLSIPGKLIEIVAELDPTFRIGKVDFDGIKKDVNLAMVPEANIGDYVLVHVGAAISVVDEEEARVTFDILMKLGETDELNMTEWTKEIIKKDIQRPSSPELNNETKKAKMNDDSPQENVWD